MFKITVLGNNLSGKTRFCTKVCNLDSIREYHGFTAGYAMYRPQTIAKSSVGDDVYLCDIGREGMRDGYIMHSNAAVIIYNNRSSKRRYTEELRELCGDVPVVYIKSKNIDAMTCDEAQGKVMSLVL
jgi:GTPase SAR1 family protein